MPTSLPPPKLFQSNNPTPTTLFYRRIYAHLKQPRTNPKTKQPADEDRNEERLCTRSRIYENNTVYRINKSMYWKRPDNLRDFSGVFHRET